MSVNMNTVAGDEMLVLDAARRFPQVNVFGLNPKLIKTVIWSNFLGGNKLVSSLVEGLIGLLSPSAKVYAERMALLMHRQPCGYKGHNVDLTTMLLTHEW